MDYRTEVTIIGGGATGAGILRDLSMRGIGALLLEQGDLAHGTSSRFHGLLHSGARYAVKDPQAAAECATENEILKGIAPQCIVKTEGWFVLLEEDNPDYAQVWLEGCRRAGIKVKEIEASLALSLEPKLSPSIRRVFEVPDGAVDGFKLVWANAKSASRYGGRYLTYHQVRSLEKLDYGTIMVRGISLLDSRPFTVYSRLAVNAAGAWAGQVASSAGAELEVICDKGTLLAYNQRLVQRVINRLRLPDSGDIFVPHESITILGTTSDLVGSPEQNQPLPAEVNFLVEEGAKLIPMLPGARVIRAFAGVRPLYREDRELQKEEDENVFAEVAAAQNAEAEASGEGREVSRNFALIDHGKQGEMAGLLSIVGGKFTTYRLMAEKVADWAAKQLGNSIPCRTGEERLAPPISEALRQRAKELLPGGGSIKMLERLGEGEASLVLDRIEKDPALGQILCECEMVTRAEVERIVSDRDTHHLDDVRRKTRLGMGTCQGAFCTYRALPLLYKQGKRFEWAGELTAFLDQRWKGIHPVLKGQQIRVTELARAIYAGLLEGDGEKP